MRINVSALELKSALAAHRRITRKKLLPLSDHIIWIPDKNQPNQITLVTHNLEQGVQTVLKAQEIENPIETLIPFEPLMNALEPILLDKPIQIEIEEFQMKLTTPYGQYKFASLPKEDNYVPLPEPNGIRISLPGKTFLQALEQVRPAISKNARTDLQSILIETRQSERDISFVATDTVRLVYSTFPVSEPVGDIRAVLPYEFVQLLLDMNPSPESVELVIQNNKAWVNDKAWVITNDKHSTLYYTTLFIEPYPQWRRVIPDYENPAFAELQFTREELISQLQHLMKFNEEKYACKTIMQYDPSENKVQLEYQDQTTKVQLQLEPQHISGEPPAFAFNTQLLLPLLKHTFNQNTITILIENPTRPIVLHEGNPKEKCGILMPMQL